MPTLDRSKYRIGGGCRQGPYILTDAPDGKPDVISSGTGSEVSLCIEAPMRSFLGKEIKSRVVACRPGNFFDHQSEEYRDAVLPSSVKARVSVEQPPPWDGNATRTVTSG